MKQVKPLLRNNLNDDKLQQQMHIKLEGPHPDDESPEHAELMKMAASIYLMDPRKVGPVYGLDDDQQVVQAKAEIVISCLRSA